MERYLITRQRIQQNLKGIRSDTIRRKARLIILVLEAKSIRQGCDAQGLVRQTFYAWLNCLKENAYDLNCLQDQSRRPHHSPHKTSEEDENFIVELYKKHGNSDRKLAIEFENQKGRRIGHSTICEIIKRKGYSKKYRTIKPNVFSRRYSASKPLERTQADTLWTGLTDNFDHRVYMVGFIDDCSRHTFGELWNEKGGFEATSTLEIYLTQIGLTQLVQTDNGTEFTNRYVSELNHTRQKESKLAAFEQLLVEYEVEHHLIRPRTPQHNGKIERFNQTVLREFSARVPDKLPLDQYRVLFKEYLKWYNEKRPHSSLNYLTPASVFHNKKSTKAA